MLIHFIGAGNVAGHLALALQAAGHRVGYIYSRQLANAVALAERVTEARAVESLNLSQVEPGLFLLAVPDDALPQVATDLQVPAGSLLAHVSGSLPLTALPEKPSVQRGVFYPLQTFSRQRALDLRTVPFCIEGETEAVAETLVQLARTLSDSVQVVSSGKRRTLHVAAVFASNFTNHLLAQSSRLTAAEELDFNLLHPLVTETFAKALAASDPATVQTGPARRHDTRTITAHLEYLAPNPELQQLYRLLSESIGRLYP